MIYYLFIILVLFTLPDNILSRQIITSKKAKITLKVLLVEFADVKHRDTGNLTLSSKPAYTYNDFYNMLFSVNKYYSPNMYSPDYAEVFGSLRDYYSIMSNGKLDIKGSILNYDKNNDNIPDWISLEMTKEFYDSKNGERFRADAKSAAKLNGLNIDTDDSTFLAILYSGNTYRSAVNTLNPQAIVKEHEYIMGERYVAGSPFREERDDPKLGPISRFAHIGIHAHEFGHLLGLEDHDGGKNNENWCLMSKGCLNGPKYEGSCPAPLNPYLRNLLGWIEIENEKINSRVTFKYNLRQPQICKIQDSKSKCYFLVEFRKLSSLIRIDKNYYSDNNSYIKNVSLESGVLVWRKLDGDFVKLIYSGGENCTDGNSHLFPGSCNIKVVTPWSDNRPRKMGYYWVPNTKPSLNCGLEIISLNNENAIIDLYQMNPWLSSPSRPKGVIIYNAENVSVKWESNTEPDFNYYKIYKKKNNVEYGHFANSTSNSFVDTSELVDTSSVKNSIAYYKITTVDFSNKESTYSDEIKAAVKNNSISHCDAVKGSIQKVYLQQNYPNPFNPITTISYTIPQSVIPNLSVRPAGSVRDLSPQIPEQSLPVGRQARNDNPLITLKVYDILGREVETLVNQKQNPGNYDVTWNAVDQTSGVYFYQLIAGASTSMSTNKARSATNSYVETRKMLMIK